MVFDVLAEFLLHLHGIDQQVSPVACFQRFETESLEFLPSLIIPAPDVAHI